MAPGLVERVSCPLSHFERTVWRHDVRRRFVKIIFAILSGCHFPHKSPWTWRSVTAMNHLPFELVSFELDWRRRCRVELLQIILMQPFFPLPSRSGFSCPNSVHQMPSPAIKDNAWYQDLLWQVFTCQHSRSRSWCCFWWCCANKKLVKSSDRLGWTTVFSLPKNKVEVRCWTCCRCWIQQLVQLVGPGSIL